MFYFFSPVEERVEIPIFFNEQGSCFDTDARNDLKVQCTQVDLFVTLEFCALLNTGESPSSCLNKMLTNIQRRIRSDPRLAGVNTGIPGAPTPSDTPLVIDVAELGNTVNVESYAEKAVEGAVFVRVKYRHAENDPRVVA